MYLWQDAKRQKNRLIRTQKNSIDRTNCQHGAERSVQPPRCPKTLCAEIYSEYFVEKQTCLWSPKVIKMAGSCAQQRVWVKLTTSIRSSPRPSLFSELGTCPRRSRSNLFYLVFSRMFVFFRCLADSARRGTFQSAADSPVNPQGKRTTTGASLARCLSAPFFHLVLTIGAGMGP